MNKLREVYNKMDDDLRIGLNFTIVSMVYFVIPAYLFVYIHECGHLVVGTLFGYHMKDFFISGKYGYVTFQEPASSGDPLSFLLIFLAGGVVETLVYIVLGELTLKEFKLLGIMSMSYAIWEGVRGLILVSFVELYPLYMSIRDPVLIIACATFYIIAVIKIWRASDEAIAKWRKRIFEEQTERYGL